MEKGRRIVVASIGLVFLLIIIGASVYSFFYESPEVSEAASRPNLVETMAIPTITPEPPPVQTPLPSPELLIDVVVSLQTVPRGWKMTEDELTIDKRVASNVPDNVITRVEDAIGLYAGNDIFQGQTVTIDSLVRDPTSIAVEEFGPSWLIPQGWVALAVPMDQFSGVADGLAPGDMVDVMLTVTLNEIDDEFQTLLANSATFYLQETIPGGEEANEIEIASILVVNPYGRFETIATGDLVHIAPSESSKRPTPVSIVLQNAMIIHVGSWLSSSSPTSQNDSNFISQPPNLDSDDKSDPVLLVALPPQQQLFLKYALEVDAEVAFALRAYNDVLLHEVDNVDLSYLLERFGITVPPKYNYAPGIFNPDETTSTENLP